MILTHVASKFYWIFKWLSTNIANMRLLIMWSFQFTIFNAGILAHCASLRLFPRVGPLVLLQMAWMNWVSDRLGIQVAVDLLRGRSRFCRSIWNNQSVFNTDAPNCWNLICHTGMRVSLNDQAYKAWIHFLREHREVLNVPNENECNQAVCEHRCSIFHEREHRSIWIII